MFLSRPEIAVVEITGAIGGNIRSGEYSRLFRRLRDDPRTRAVLLEIDSPGGSAIASDYLYLSLLSLAKAKPLVAFVRGLGASGGYYLACSAARIIASPGAIIGSIGVISVRPVLQELMSRIGVSVSVSKSGPLKDMGAPYKEPSLEELAKEEELIADLFQRFVDIVATARKMPEDRVREYATGEIFLGTRAKEIGLVDETGDFDRALEITAELAGVRPRYHYVRPRQPLFQRVLSPAGAAFARQLTVEVESRLSRRYL